jgi:cell division initiation protein
MEEETSREKKMLVEVLGEPIALAPSDLYDARFKRTVLGYKPSQVRESLDSVADDIERLIEQNRRLRFQLEQVQDQLGEYRRTEESLKNALVSSEKLRSEILSEARKEAELLVENARLEAKKVYQEAERTREAIKQEIARLALQKERFRAEFAAVIDAHRELLEKAHEIGSKEEEQ